MLGIRHSKKDRRPNGHANLAVCVADWKLQETRTVSLVE